MRDLEGQTAIVTGASAPNGIGRAIATRLAQDGANVVVTDLKRTVNYGGIDTDSADLLRDVVEEISDFGGSALALTLDVTAASEIAECVERTLGTYGSIDVLVNNAATLAGSDKFLATTAAQWEASFKVNLLGPMMTAQAVIPHMQKRGKGRIINIGSTGSLGAEPGFGAYTAMKHGLIGLTKTLAAEFGVDGVLCNAVCPG